MRSAVVVISLVFAALVGHSQEWSEKAHYDAYMKGDWKEVIRLGKVAKKEGVDYYYVRVRNGYANFMLGKYFKAENEFEKALKFNSSDAFSKRYGYWSSVYAGNTSTALVKADNMSDAERDTIKAIKPKWLYSVSVVGGYRLSTSSAFSVNLPPDINGNEVRATVDPPSSMPYFSVYLNHQIGRRFSLNHAVNYISSNRTGQITPTKTPTVSIWQVGYLASLSIQVSEKTTLTPSFIMQYWNDSLNKVYDLSASIAIRQQFGSLYATVIGGYFQDTDTNKYMIGGSLTWYPLNNQRFFTITSGGYNFGGDAPNPFVRQTIGGNLFKRAWLSSSFTWNNRVISFEDVGLDFVNNATDRLVWLWSVTPSYFATDKLRISLTYSFEARRFFLPSMSNPQNTGESGQFSEKYYFHSFYLGLNYNF